jgi:hypothetical protein
MKAATQPLAASTEKPIPRWTPFRGSHPPNQ